MLTEFVKPSGQRVWVNETSKAAALALGWKPVETKEKKTK